MHNRGHVREGEGRERQEFQLTEEWEKTQVGRDLVIDGPGSCSLKHRVG